MKQNYFLIYDNQNSKLNYHCWQLDNKCFKIDDKGQLQLVIGERVKMLREKRGIPKQDLAAKCNLEKSNLSSLEAGL